MTIFPAISMGVTFNDCFALENDGIIQDYWPIDYWYSREHFGGAGNGSECQAASYGRHSGSGWGDGYGDAKGRGRGDGTL